MATYYIRGDGNDTTGDGLTPATAWLTMSKAFSSSGSGDTIICVGGFGNLSWASQLFSSPRTIQGSGSPIFDGASADNNPFWNIQANITVTGLAFQNGGGGGATTLFLMTVDGLTVSFTNCSISSCITAVTFGLGSSKTSTLNITGCLITNIRYTSNAFSLFISPIGAATSSTVNFINCTYYDDVPNANNVAFSSAGGGSGVNNFTIKNCIIWNANGVSMAWSQTGSTEATYAGTNNIIKGWTSPPSLANQSTADPLFVDAAGANFNLRPTSPAIGAGVVI